MFHYKLNYKYYIYLHLCKKMVFDIFVHSYFLLTKVRAA